MINSMPKPIRVKIIGTVLLQTGWTAREIGSTANWIGREIGSMIDSMPEPIRPEIMDATLWPSDYIEREIGSTASWTGREIGSTANWIGWEIGPMVDSISKPIGLEIINAMLWPSDYTETVVRSVTVFMLDGTTSDATGFVVETTKANSAFQVLETPKGFIEVKGAPKVPEGWRVDKIIKLAGPIPGP